MVDKKSSKKSKTVSWSQRRQGFNRPGETRERVINDRFRSGSVQGFNNRNDVVYGGQKQNENNWGGMKGNAIKDSRFDLPGKIQKDPFGTNQGQGKTNLDPHGLDLEADKKPLYGTGTGVRQNNEDKEWLKTGQTSTAAPQDIWRVSDASRFYGRKSKNEDFFKDELKRIVHLDLKGAAPNMKYIRTLIPFFKKLGATGLLVEYEDMFPYEGELSEIPAKNHYTKDNINEIVKLAKDNELSIIPLIQTFGHMEFLLKVEKYKALRELESQPFTISPALDSSYAMINSIIKQVVDMHPDSEHIHIGCDEVFHLGKPDGMSTKTFKDKKPSDIFLQHVITVARNVKSKFNKKPIMWDDMLRKISVEALQVS